jgi:translocation and assembly module TamB
MIKTHLQKLFRIFRWFSLGLLVLVVLGLVLLQTPLARKIILRTVLAQANQSLNGKISVAALEGNFFSRLKLREILVQTEKDTLLKLASLEVAFNPFSLLSREFKIARLRLDAPEIFLYDSPEGWNFSSLLLVTADSGSKSPADTSGGISVKIARVELRNGQFSLRDSQQILPEIRICQIFLDASARYAADSLDATVKRFTWNGQIADLELKHFFFKGYLRGERLGIDSLKIASDSSQFFLKGQVNLNANLDFNLRFSANPLARSDLLRINPTLPAYPLTQIRGELAGNLQQFAVTTWLEFQQEQIEFVAQIALKPRQTFSATLTTRRLNLQSIQGLDLPPSDLSLNLQIVGENFNLDSLQATAQLDVSAPGTFNRQPLRQLTARLNYRHQELNAAFSLALKAVSAKISGRLNLARPPLVYAGEIDLAGPVWYELANLGAADDQLELHAQVTGRGITPEEMNARAEIFARKLETQGIRVDSLRARMRFSDALLSLDSVRVNAPFGNLHLSGRASFRDSLIFANYQFTDLNLAALPGDSLAGTGNLIGTVSGRFDSLVTVGRGVLAKIAYGTNRIEQTKLDYKILLVDTLPRISAEIQAADIFLGSFKIDSLRSHARLFGSQIDAHVRASADTLGNLTTEFSLEFNDSLVFTFHQLHLNALGYHFSNCTRPFRVTLLAEKIRIDSLELADQNQRLSLHGWLEPERAQNLHFQTENLDLSPLGEFAALPVAGNLNAAAQISGSFQHPQAEMTAELLRPTFGDFPFEMLKITAELKQNHASASLSLDDPTLGTVIHFSAATDFLSDTTLSWFERFTDFSELRLRFNGLQLALVNDFLTNKTELTGQVEADLTLHHLLTDLTGQGYFSLTGALRSPVFGIDYKSLLLNFELDQKNLVLNNFSILTSKGWLQGQGKIGLSKNLDSQFALLFTAKNFEAVNSKLAQLQLNADLEILGSVKQPEFKGKIELERGRVNLPPFLKLTPVTPTLIEPEPVFPQIAATDSASTTGLLNLMLKDLRGTLTLTIPRNTWLRNEEINIELSGELELIKKSADFALFGPVRVVRGNVQFYGKKFIIEKGELVFRGLYPPDPEIYILASFRHPDVLIQLLVGGTANAPQLTLQSTPEMEQRDIFSYLLFGKPFAYLSGEQKDNLGGENALLTNAMGIAVGLLAGELTRAVAKQLQLDIIEFSQGTDWQSSTLKVGKYVGKGMFVFYSRDLVGANETVSLEYQINPNWLLKADQTTSGSAGVDLWWQKEW